MPITYCNIPLDPEKVAKALKEYQDKYGPPPAVMESLHVYVDARGEVHIETFSVKETA